MNIAVISGSPKAKHSVTLEYTNYIKKHFPEHNFEVINAAVEITKIEKNREALHASVEKIRNADAVIWSFPVYVLLVPAQYKRWIELINEEGLENAFAGKPCIAISTSIHFFDDTAHNYLRAICDDWKMRYIGNYSAEMFDLMQGKERKRLLAFANLFFGAVTSGFSCAPAFLPLVAPALAYEPGKLLRQVDNGTSRTIILAEKDEGNLAKMIERVQANLNGKAEVFYLEDLDIRGGCIGCCVCGLDNQCSYRDGYREFYEGPYKTADTIIMALRVRDRFLSARWKQFIDRSFFNGHTPTLIGKQLAFIVTGPFQQTSNIRTILSAYAGFQQAHLVDVVSDEVANSATLDERLDNLCTLLTQSQAHGYIPPPNFLAVAGKKVFRDEIYGKLRFVFQADHRYYKKHGYYDFPQKQHKIRRRNVIMMALTKIPFFRKEFLKRIIPEMVAPLRHVVKNK
ncbi:MAG: NAD(P)H-dependent oxidoreductase [Deltaproteobacteria bacterium]|nr:NAD(P)H-dependent oxidoreductase [Deltaproteobacteria bacterium]